MSDSKRQRRSYTPEYRIEAANLVISTGRSIAAVAKDLGVGEQTLGTWVKAEKDRLRGEGESTGPLGEDERAELARLKRENFELKQDNEFLGKAALDSNRECNTPSARRRTWPRLDDQAYPKKNAEESGSCGRTVTL
ncbi:transposase, partial [Brevibacterium antiquum]